MRETERQPAQFEAEATPSLDLVFDLLSNRRRRYALYYLHDQPDGVATVEEITDSVVAFERRDRPEASGDLERQRTEVRTDLKHLHLPKLEDVGVLEHDARSETVRFWSQPSLEELLEHAYHKEHG